MKKNNKIPLSVFLITKNEESRIIRSISSVISWVDEVIVVDSGSVDNTVNIARKLGAKVIFHKWRGYGTQKIFGEKQCRNKWILNIDADEEVTKLLRNEIIELFKSQKIEKYVGYRIKITNTFPNEKKPKKFAYYYNQTRLYNRQSVGFRNSTVHDCAIINGIKEYSKEERQLIGKLKGRIAHYFVTSYTQWIQKLNRMSKMQAVDYIKKGKKVSKTKILFAPTFYFLKAYFIRRYFIYGFNGIIYSRIYAFGRFMKYIKIREMNK